MGNSWGDTFIDTTQQPEFLTDTGEQCDCGHPFYMHSGREGYGCDECDGGQCAANRME